MSSEVGDSSAKKPVEGCLKSTAVGKKTISAVTTHAGKYICLLHFSSFDKITCILLGTHPDPRLNVVYVKKKFS